MSFLNFIEFPNNFLWRTRTILILSLSYPCINYCCCWGWNFPPNHIASEFIDWLDSCFKTDFLFVLQDHKLPRRKFFKKPSNPFLASPTLHKPFLQKIYGTPPQTLIYERASTRISSGTYRTVISAEAGRQSWDFGRFIKTLYFFNGPPSPAKVSNLINFKLV